MAVAKECGSPLGESKQNVLATDGVFGNTSFTTLVQISSVLQKRAEHCESFRMYVQSLGSCVSYMGTIAALREYAADARAAHSQRLLDMRPILSYSLTPVYYVSACIK